MPEEYASGSNARFLIDREASFRKERTPKKGVLLPFNTTGLKAAQAMETPDTRQSGREPMEPLPKFAKYSGPLSAPMDATAMGYMLCSAIGLPVSTAYVDVALVNVPAVDLGDGLVGFAVNNHGLTAGMEVLFTGTTNYDGQYSLHDATTDSMLVIEDTFAAETVANGDVILGGMEASGAVVNLGGGMVSIPLPVSGYIPGDEVVISLSTNYNGTYTLEDGTDPTRIVITHAFTAETLAGAIVQPKLYKHVFTIQNSLPSLVGEIQNPDIDVYQKFNGIMAGTMGFKLGGDGELVVTFDLVGAEFTVSDQPYQPDPAEPPLTRITFEEVKLISMNGAASHKIREFEFNVNNSIDSETGYTVAGGSSLSVMTAGAPKVSGKINALFSDAEFINLGKSKQTIPFKVAFCRPHEVAVLELPWSKIALTSVPVQSGRTMTADFDWSAYKPSYASGSAVRWTLINQIAEY